MTLARVVAVLVLLTASLWAQSNPVPLISNPLKPTAVVAGGPGITLTVNGTGFTSGSAIKWNSGLLNTTFVSAFQLTAPVSANLVSKDGFATVTVSTPPPGGGTSNAIVFEIGDSTLSATYSESDYAAAGSDAAVVGDFNNDGKQDVATASYGFGPTQVLLGNGDGTLQLGIPVAAPEDCRDIATGDLNHDGNLDLIVSCTGLESGVAVSLGNGDGTFQDYVLYGGGIAAIDAYQAALGDLNGDGNLDMVVVGAANYGIYVFLGIGDGTFGPATEYFISPNYPTSVTLGDFNRDGKLDVAANAGGNVNIFLGNGDGTLGLSQLSAPTAYLLSMVLLPWT